MKEIINILVVEDNEYYNNLISSALKKSIHFTHHDKRYKLMLYSYTDFFECIMKIRSNELSEKELIAFVDYNLGDEITGDQIISLLKKQNSSTIGVLLSHSDISEGQKDQYRYDYLVKKDIYTPALCRLYLDQFIDNKFL